MKLAATLTIITLALITALTVLQMQNNIRLTQEVISIRQELNIIKTDILRLEIQQNEHNKDYAEVIEIMDKYYDKRMSNIEKWLK